MGQSSHSRGLPRAAWASLAGRPTIKADTRYSRCQRICCMRSIGITLLPDSTVLLFVTSTCERG